MLLIFGNSIIAFILSTLSQLADSLQSVVPGMSLVSSFLDYVAIAAYFVPIDTIVILFSCIVLREIFKIGLFSCTLADGSYSLCNLCG